MTGARPIVQASSRAIAAWRSLGCGGVLENVVEGMLAGVRLERAGELRGDSGGVEWVARYRIGTSTLGTRPAVIVTTVRRATVTAGERRR